MFIVAQRVGGTIHEMTNVSFTNTKLIVVSEEVVGSSWIFFTVVITGLQSLPHMNHSHVNKIIFWLC